MPSSGDTLDALPASNGRALEALEHGRGAA
jgi:hypothetical protein